MNYYAKPTTVKDLRASGRVILAHGEATGHAHEIVAVDAEPGEIPAAEFFEEPSGRRVLMVLRRCELTHQDHSVECRTFLAPSGRAEKVSTKTGLVIETHEYPQTQVRQGDVILLPLAPGVWQAGRQREYAPEAIRNVSD